MRKIVFSNEYTKSWFFTVFMFILLLNGCGGPKQLDQRFLFWRQQEARLYDIPIMMHAKPDYAYQNNDDVELTTVIAYTVESTFNDVQTYYVNQMERYGWRHIALVSGCEITLIFEKPQKLCVLSVRPTQSKNISKVVVTQSYVE